MTDNTATPVVAINNALTTVTVDGCMSDQPNLDNFQFLQGPKGRQDRHQQLVL